VGKTWDPNEGPIYTWYPEVILNITGSSEKMAGLVQQGANVSVVVQVMKSLQSLILIYKM
jgi:hypothetical protein